MCSHKLPTQLQIACRWAPTYLQNATRDIRCDFRVRSVFIFPQGSQVVFQAGVPEPHEGLGMLFNGPRLSDGCCDSCDTDFNHCLVIVIGLVVLVGKKTLMLNNILGCYPSKGEILARLCRKWVCHAGC
jgi:hypothetical protein